MGAVDLAVKLIVGIIPEVAKVFQADVNDIKAALAKHPEIQSRASDQVLDEIVKAIEAVRRGQPIGG